MMAGPDHPFHHHLSLNQGDGKGLILRSRLTPHEQVIALPKGWHRAITPHTHNKELLPLVPLWAHRDYRFDVLYREQRNAGSNLPHHGNVPDNIASRPCHRSTQGQAPCLERTSVEGALALKGSEVGQEWSRHWSLDIEDRTPASRSDGSRPSVGANGFRQKSGRQPRFAAFRWSGSNAAPCPDYGG